MVNTKFANLYNKPFWHFCDMFARLENVWKSTFSSNDKSSFSTINFRLLEQNCLQFQSLDRYGGVFSAGIATSKRTYFSFCHAPNNYLRIGYVWLGMSLKIFVLFPLATVDGKLGSMEPVEYMYSDMWIWRPAKDPRMQQSCTLSRRERLCRTKYIP